MSEVSFTSRHPYTNNGLALKLQKLSDASSLPSLAHCSMTTATTSYATAVISFLAYVLGILVLEFYVKKAFDDQLESKLWYAYAGPRKALPPIGSVVAYLPNGHIEQVDQETDELYVTLTLVPFSEASEDSLDYFEPPICTRSKTRSFIKTLTLLARGSHF
ncbi:hypothetical protein R1sor_015711 [Riccia sorocarpa]|uniref:Uncharacterized protein n=1 Tax=Riccia sorocarpa TaxID=122646 RepID=A0ABD3HD04_9MARC